MQQSSATLLIAAAALAAGCSHGVNAENAAAGPVTLVVQTDAALEVVLVGKPQRKTLQLVTSQPARIEAFQQAPIHSKLAAYVEEVFVDYGDEVRQDQPLVKLAAPELDADVAQKNALVAQAKAEQTQAEAGATAAKAAVVTARSQVAQAEARLEKAKADVHLWMLKSKRFEELARGGSVNQQLVEETAQSYAAAQAANKEAALAIDAALAAVAQGEAQAAKAQADVKAAGSRVVVAYANLTHAEALRSYLTIKAPFAGVVTRRQVDPGHFSQPGPNGTTLLVVARTDRVRVFTAIPEMEAAHVDVGDNVTIEVQSLKGEAFPGRVDRTSFAIDAASRSLDTIMDIDNEHGRLRPGMYATARLTLAERKDVLTLPSAAVIRQGKETLCFRLEHGKATRQLIELGVRVGDDFEITSGLDEDDAVILNKSASLQDGQEVQALQPPPSGSR
jgi:RND family efflux transporter MFP subunit